MAKKKDVKIGGVKRTKGATGVEQTESVGEVKGVKKARSVGGVKGVGKAGAGGGKLPITAAERDQLFQMINEEAEKMFEGSSILPEEQKKIVTDAVKMAVDASVIDEEDEEEKPKEEE